jgi:hypothetical protein
VTTRVVVQIALCAVASACVKIPAFEQRDAPTGDGSGSDALTDGSMPAQPVKVEMVGANAKVTGPGYTLTFSSDGAKFPHLLTVNPSTPQFLMGGSEQCADEMGMGIALYPATRINGVTGTSPTLSIPLEGPYVGQVRLEWSGTYPCPTPGSGTLQGRTTFSFFPDGRLTRFDVVDNVATRNVTDCTPCGNASSSFFLTSYTTLIVDGNAFLSDGTQSTLDNYGEQVQPGRSACINERGYSIAFAWVDASTRMRVAAAPPTSQARTIAFVKDLEPPAATLGAGERRATTQMGISTEGCGALEARIAPFSDDDHQLMVNGVASGAALVDGIFGGDPQTSGYVVDFPVTLTPAPTIAPNVPGGFAVWLYHAPLPQTLTPVHSGNPTGTWYYEQRVNQNSVVFWFNEPLDQNETITITGS